MSEARPGHTSASPVLGSRTRSPLYCNSSQFIALCLYLHAHIGCANNLVITEFPVSYTNASGGAQYSIKRSTSPACYTFTVWNHEPESVTFRPGPDRTADCFIAVPVPASTAPLDAEAAQSVTCLERMRAADSGPGPAPTRPATDSVKWRPNRTSSYLSAESEDTGEPVRQYDESRTYHCHRCWPARYHGPRKDRYSSSAPTKTQDTP